MEQCLHLLRKNYLIVNNTLQQKCKGVITIRRTMEESVEESVIDFLIISVDIMHGLKDLIIYEEKGLKLVTTDHNVVLSKLKVPVEANIDKERIEIFNFRNKANQKLFTEATNKTTKLSEVFDANQDINTQTKKFLKILEKTMNKFFKKVRVGGEIPSEY